MEIRALDAGDPDAMAAWHATYHAGHAFGRDLPTVWNLEELRAELLGVRTARLVEPYGGYVDGVPVVAGIVTLPQLESRHVARLDLTTGPDHRRDGHGSAMLEHLVARAVAHGRDTLQVEAEWGYDEPADGAGTAGADFLTGHGFTFSLGDVKRALALPVDEALLDRLAREAAPHHTGYTLRHWRGRVPDDVVDGFAGLIGSLMTEAPQGELDVQEEVVDRARIRSDEDVLAASGRTKHTTVAVAGDGELVAYSELVASSHEPERAHQWGTLVRAEHRGHRLGLATKTHNLRWFQPHGAGCEALLTWNAESNGPMVAINDALGFRPVGRLGEFQRRL